MTPSCWAGMPVLSTPLSLPTWNSEPGSFWGPQISSGFPRPLGKSHDPSPYLLPPGWAHRTGGASGHAAWGQAPRPAADGLAPGPRRPHSDLSAGRRTRRAHPPSACGHRPKQQPPWQPGTQRTPSAPPHPCCTLAQPDSQIKQHVVLGTDPQVGPDGRHAGLDIITQDEGGAAGGRKEAAQDGPGGGGVSEWPCPRKQN